MPVPVQLLNFPGLPELGPEFHYRLVEMAARLRLNPSYIAGVMYHESGFKPEIRNPWSGATGLIQWMPSTARAFGLTTDEIARMTAVQQLEPTERYFRAFAGRATTMADHYLIVFWPAAVGKPSSYALASSGSAAYSQNKGLDKDNDGAITVQDIETQMRDNVLARAAGRPPIVVPDAPDPTWRTESRPIPVGAIMALIAGLAAGAYGALQAARVLLK